MQHNVVRPISGGFIQNQWPFDVLLEVKEVSKHTVDHPLAISLDDGKRELQGNDRMLWPYRDLW